MGTGVFGHFCTDVNVLLNLYLAPPQQSVEAGNLLRVVNVPVAVMVDIHQRTCPVAIASANSHSLSPKGDLGLSRKLDAPSKET